MGSETIAGRFTSSHRTVAAGAGLCAVGAIWLTGCVTVPGNEAVTDRFLVKSAERCLLLAGWWLMPLLADAVAAEAAQASTQHLRATSWVGEGAGKGDRILQVELTLEEGWHV